MDLDFYKFEPTSKEFSEAFMTRLDQDGDGSVDFLEFVAFMLESK